MRFLYSFLILNFTNCFGLLRNSSRRYLEISTKLKICNMSALSTKKF